MLKPWGSVGLMIAIPFCEVLNKDNGTSSKEENEEFIKRIHQRKVKVQSIELGQKKIHRDKILRKHQTLWKKKRPKKKGREIKKKRVEEFSISC